MTGNYDTGLQGLGAPEQKRIAVHVRSETLVSRSVPSSADASLVFRHGMTGLRSSAIVVK
jgi:hypothetical protein